MRNGRIDAPLAADLTAAVGLRNRIAHGYASVDVGRLWRELPEGLGALERFVEAVSRHLGDPAGSSS